ncbi:MAG: dipicolinate synthase subunit DpsA [Firmicutes bacterium]|nr:dipicolinate synthase subunit DpsA [Bacillota bacterium]
METALAGKRITILGGDARQMAVAKALAAAGALVRIYAVPSFSGPAEGVEVASTLREALIGAEIVVLPIGGVSAEGKVAGAEGAAFRLDEEFWSLLVPSCLLVVGRLPDDLRRKAIGEGHRVLEYAEDDEIAILNSIPTAEGALQLAMEALPITIHGACVFVLGFGRVGMTVARLFRAVGAETWVVADRPALLARAYEMGCRPLEFSRLAEEIHRADLMVNTIPAPVLSAGLLGLTKPEVYIIDLASAPGGVDFQAARDLGRKTTHALGLPGKVAPVTAGRILARTLSAMIARKLAEEERQDGA